MEAPWCIRRGPLLVLVLAGAMVGAPAATATAVPAAAGPGTTRVETYDASTGVVHYRVYTPAGYRTGSPVPMVVFLHGCSTTAEQQENASLYDDVAAAHDFVVVYPDDDDLVHPAQCWQFYNPQNSDRGEGDLATVAGITHAVMAQLSIDPQRVYAVGMSSGALIMSDLGAAYPDLYAAIGIMAGGPYGAPATCLLDRNGLNVGTDPVTLGREAEAEMGSAAHVMPFIVLNGDADGTVPPQCDDDAVTQWITTDNLVATGTTTGPFGAEPIATRSVTPSPPDRSYEVLTYGTSTGCVVGEHWIIHGMGHYWSGGSTDSAYSAFVDPTGPSASEATWEFFSHFTLSSHEACPAPPSSSCTRAGWVSIRAPRGPITATVNGRRITAHRQRSGRVRLDLDRFAGRRVRIVLRAGRRTVRRTITLCA
jgi:poly(hydroxyalkanoate) depolymerase family esterase